MTTLTPAAIRRIYDRIGRAQDTQAFYEDRATAQLIAHMALPDAHAVFELGSGTGRFAETLFAHHLPADARYRSRDLSPVMVDLARKRLARFGERARVDLTDGAPPSDEPTGAYDRAFANFVLDLLPNGAIPATIAELHRLLGPGGLLGACSLTPGFTPASRLVARVWIGLHSLRPSLTGGCRPIELATYFSGDRWMIRYQARLAPWGVPLAVVVAEARPAPVYV